MIKVIFVINVELKENIIKPLHIKEKYNMIEKLILLETEQGKTYYLSSINDVYYWSQSTEKLVTDLVEIKKIWLNGDVTDIELPSELKYENYTIKLCEYKYSNLYSISFEKKLHTKCSNCDNEFIDNDEIYCHQCGTKRIGEYVGK
jgi:hypothetical protein